jgi:hypothetical protein
MTPSRIWLRTARTQVAQAGVRIAAVIGLLGQFITFYPGAEVGWFGVAALALAGYSPRLDSYGLSLPSWWSSSLDSHGAATYGGGSIDSG